MTRRLLAFIIAAVLVAGIVGLTRIGDRPHRAASPVPSPTATGPDPRTLLPTPLAPAAGSTAAPRIGATGSPRPVGSGTAPAARNTFRLTLAAPTCARQGVPLGVTVRTEPQADIALILSFSDGESHDSYQLGTADSQGRFFTQMAIPATAPTGPAKVLAAAGKEHLGGNVAEHRFTLVGPAGSCT